MASTQAAFAVAAMQRDKTNAFLLSNQGELFFPQGANVSYLLKDSVTKELMNGTFAMLAESGVNTVRVVLEDAVDGPATYQDLFDRTGAFVEPVQQRFDQLLTLANKHGLQVLPVLFDLQSMQENWDASPQNKANGGPCETIHDFFLQSTIQQKSITRMREFTKRFQGRNILAWEVARGANIWEATVPNDTELHAGALMWFNLLLDQLHRDNVEHQLTAVSFLPNTLPFELMESVDVLFVHFRSHSSALTASSIQSFLEACRKQRRPVFMCEATYTSKLTRRDLFFHTLFWSTLAMDSSVFLSPVQVGEHWEFSSFDLLQTKTRSEFMPLLDFTGPARPPSEAKVEVLPKGQFALIDTIVGYDRFFWLYAQRPGDNKAQLHLQTIEGVYEIQWFDIENQQPYKRNRFNLWRKDLNLATPTFDQSLFGVLRLVGKNAPKQKNGTPASGPSDANAPSLGTEKDN